VILPDPKVDPSTGGADSDAEALIKEARRLRRRRWLIRSAIVALAGAGSVAGYFAASGHHRVPRPSTARKTPISPAGFARRFVSTRSPDLIQPTTLATLPNGDLLILDSSRDQILELTPDGDLSVFAGNGRLGFAGDGGPARDAELDFSYFSSAGMAVAPDGTVYFVDDGNCRIRAIGPGGVIRTVLRVPRINLAPQGTACTLGSVAVSPAGSVYFATSSEIERLAATGRAVWVAGTQGETAHEPVHLTPSNIVFSPDSLAFDHTGDLDIFSFSPRVIYQLTPAGKLTQLGGWTYATQLTSDRNGDVLAGTHFGVIEEVALSAVRLFYNVIPQHVAGINWNIRGFQENGIAVTKTGTIYVDNAEGNGYGAATVLVRISPSKRAALASIGTTLAATLPKVNAPAFPASLYPSAGRSRGLALSSCPSQQGLQPFNARAIGHARVIAQTYLSSQFAADIAVTDRSWWTGDFNDYASGDLGRHTVESEVPASKSPIATGIAQACGPQLLADSIAIKVGASAYSDYAGTFYFLDRDGHPLVYDIR
jgi:hypothetical protein